MGNSKSKATEEESILTNYHRSYSRIYSEITVEPILTETDLLKIFPNRTLFCDNFLKWMKILSYKKTANKESFIFACEVLTLDPEDIIVTAYKNHSFVFIDLFMHMCLQQLPTEINEVSNAQLANFAATFVNFFFKDQNKVVDLSQKIGDIVRVQSDIQNKGVPFRVVMKSAQ